MTKFKRIAAGVIAAATMVVTGVTATAETWKIDYTFGAPSSVSNQFVKFTHSSHTLNWAMVSCDYVNAGGVVELTSTGFNPNANSVTFTSNPEPLYFDLRNPYREVTIELWARADRVIANGFVFWF